MPHATHAAATHVNGLLKFHYLNKTIYALCVTDNRLANRVVVCSFAIFFYSKPLNECVLSIHCMVCNHINGNETKPKNTTGNTEENSLNIYKYLHFILF